VLALAASGTIPARNDGTAFTHDSLGRLLAEDGPFASDLVTNGCVKFQRTILGLEQGSPGMWQQTYGYDVAGRLTNITSPAGAFGYACRERVGPIVFAPASPTRLCLFQLASSMIQHCFSLLFDTGGGKCRMTHVLKVE
jgi:YD repeat-containing protein